jgi:hypothetical protein
LDAVTVPDHSVPEVVVKQLQLNSRGAGVGNAVGIGAGVKSGVATTPGTLVSCEGAPGRIGTEGVVSGGGGGGGTGTCARAAPANMTSASAIASVARALMIAVWSSKVAPTQAPLMILEEILIAKKVSSAKQSHQMILPTRMILRLLTAWARAGATLERAAMIRKPGARCKRGAFGQKCLCVLRSI